MNLRVLDSFLKALLFAALVASVLGTASAQERPSGSNIIHWQSKAGSPAQMSLEFADLYRTLLSLQESGVHLPIRDYVDELGRTVDRLARDEHLYDGEFYPAELNLFLCRLNRHICVERVDTTSNPAVPQISIRWQNKRGDRIVLPSIPFEQIVAPSIYVKRAGDSIEQIVRNRGGCERVDDACLKSLAILNKSNPEFSQTSYEGKILVPTRAYRARVDLGVSPEKLKEGRQPDNPFGVTEKTLELTTPRGKNEILIPDFTDIKNGSFSKRTLPSARINLEGLPALAIEGDAARVGGLISIPTNLKGFQKAAVAVLDRQVFIRHCLLHSRVAYVKAQSNGIADLSQTASVEMGDGTPDMDASPSDGHCGDIDTALLGRDHGTHVVGLLARKHGIMPPDWLNHSKVIALQLPPAEMDETLVIQAVADTINRSLLEEAIYVYNMSFTYEFTSQPLINGRDPVEDTIQTIADLNNSLFVFAAGNGGKVFADKASCGIRPACIKSNNVISVIALDLNPGAQVLASSNSGRVFDVGAPGAALESTISHHRLGAMTGTSQAAALVSGLAAMLYGKKRDAKSWEVRNRLICTADFFDSMKESLFGGRINADRALDYTMSTLTFGTPVRTVRGRTISQPVVLSFIDLEAAAPRNLRFDRICRLHRAPDQNYFRVYYLDDDGKTILRAFVEPSDPETKLPFLEATANVSRTLNVQIKDIKDFVRAMN